MPTPEFWYSTGLRESAPLARALLSPFAALYTAGGAARRAMARPHHAGVPVICAGALTLGGSGKTPIALALMGRLAARGLNVHALSRGYGGRLSGPVRVDPASHNASDVGDEPLLIANAGPTWIARDRAAGANAAEAAGADIIVMDDGHQNPDLIKDLSFVVVDPACAFGNGQVAPAGPLREPVETGLARADAVIVLNSGGDARDIPLPPDLPVLHAQLEPTMPPPCGPLVAFAGVGRPQKVFDLLAASGGQIIEEAPFSDHYVYQERDLVWLTRLAEEREAKPITTAKDYARLSLAWRDRVEVFRVSARFEDEAALDALLDKALAKGGAAR